MSRRRNKTETFCQSLAELRNEIGPKHCVNGEVWMHLIVRQEYAHYGLERLYIFIITPKQQLHYTQINLIILQTVLYLLNAGRFVTGVVELVEVVTAASTSSPPQRSQYLLEATFSSR